MIYIYVFFAHLLACLPSFGDHLESGTAVPRAGKNRLSGRRPYCMQSAPTNMPYDIEQQQVFMCVVCFHSSDGVADGWAVSALLRRSQIHVLWRRSEGRPPLHMPLAIPPPPVQE